MIEQKLAGILNLLACPECCGAFDEEAESLVCKACGSVFPIRDGVPMLATLNDEKGARSIRGPTRETYQREYQQLDAAVNYNRKYEQQVLKRWSTWREYQLLNRLLSSQPRSRTLLELPCGGGRLSPVMAQSADLMIEADVALGQVQYGRANSRSETPQVWMTASGLDIPFRDASVDGVVCVRLCHHLPQPSERKRLVSELLRVAQRFVIVTFFDHNSIKNRLRRARQRFNGKRPKYTMTREEIREIAAQHGANLVACPALSWIGSGHRYALLVKS